MSDESGQNYITRVDKVSDTEIYLGIAVRGNTSSVPQWSIMKLSINGTEIVTEYPNTDDSFKYVWDNRTTYSYS